MKLAPRVVLFLIASAVVLMVAGPVAQQNAAGIGLIASAATYGLTLLFVRWDGIAPGEVGVAVELRSFGRTAIGFVIGLAMAGAQVLALIAAGHVRLASGNQGGAGAVGLALLTYLALACREELAFRGYPLRRMDREYGPWVAQFAIALVFAAEHVAGGYSVSNALLGVIAGSLLFGMAALATGGLAVPIGIHAAWNFGQWMLGGKGADGGIWRQVTDSGFGNSMERVGMAAWLASVVVGFAGFAILYLRKSSQRSLS